MQEADLLVTTAFHATQLRAAQRRLGRPLVVVTLMPGFLEELAALVAREPVYFVGLDPRFAAKLRRIFTDVRPSANLWPMVLGRDEVQRIEPGAAVYVMPGAAPMMPRGLDVRLIRAPRVFSLETAAELLRFMDDSNIEALGS